MHFRTTNTQPKFKQWFLQGFWMGEHYNHFNSTFIVRIRLKPITQTQILYLIWRRTDLIRVLQTQAMCSLCPRLTSGSLVPAVFVMAPGVFSTLQTLRHLILEVHCESSTDVESFLLKWCIVELIVFQVTL